MQLFEKKFHYRRQNGHESWKLPPPDELYQEFYQFDTLQQLKKRLNDVKCKLNNYAIEDWSLHTRRQDPASEIPWRLKNETKAEFVTVAWCKFFECLHNFPLVENSHLNSLHLCELPGAFIAALNHYLHSKYDSEQIHWNWLSTTLNPYYEGNTLNKMITDDRFMLYTLENWLFHNDFTGNIISKTNIEEMEEQCSTRLRGEVNLITADGSIDCINTPDCQEEVLTTLHFAEITAALSILSQGGCFVLKMFTLFESTSVSMLFLLNCTFEEVHVFKPATSKRGNSEVYVICLGYMKDTKFLNETLGMMKSKLSNGQNISLPLFAKAHLPKDFLQQHEICTRMFMNFQIKAIESNISTYEIKATRYDTRRKQLLRTQVSNEFYSRYDVQSIPEESTILHQSNGKIEIGYKLNIYKGSYSEREMQKAKTVEQQIFNLRTKINELEKAACSDNQSILLSETTSTNKSHTHMSELKLYYGKPLKTLQSSLFVSVHVLMLRLQLQNIFNTEPLWQGTPTVTIKKIDLQMPVDNKSATDDFACTQQKFFVNILNAIIEQQPQQITFHNFPFLTHFAVSFLRYLSLNIFDRLIIMTEPTFQIKLSIESEKQATEYQGDKITKLIALRDLIDITENLMCLMEIKCLHRNEFCTAVTAYNNMLLLKNYNLILKN